MHRDTRCAAALLLLALLAGAAGCVSEPQTGEYTCTRTYAPGAGNIPDNDPNGLVSTVLMARGRRPRLTDVQVTVKITHPRGGDVDLTLVHPDGTAVHLLRPDPSNTSANVDVAYSDEAKPLEDLRVLNGKPLDGTWKLIVKDLREGEAGRLDFWRLSLKWKG